jgi:multiple sugar transport system permease protein
LATAVKSRISHQVESLIVYFVLTTAAVVLLLPFFWMLSVSFEAVSEVFQFPPCWIPRRLVWENYLAAWRAIPLGRYYLNSIFVASAVTISQVLNSIMAAYIFARCRFPGRDVIFILFLGTMIIPTQVTMVPLFLLLRWLGWIDTYQALIVPFIACPFGIFLMRQFFLSIPEELEDAARMDGCSRLSVLFRVILPLSTSVVASHAVFSFTWAWNSFLWPLIVIHAQSKYTLPVGLAMLQSEMGTDWPTMMAANVLATLPIILLFIVAQRHFTREITLTGLKL